ncbi:MAG: cytochrome b/b6 domain-containing protein [Terriglobales bacterium]
MADAEDKKPGPEPQELEAAKPVASQPSADGPDVSAHKADAGSLPQAERGRDVPSTSSGQAPATAGGTPALRPDATPASAAQARPPVIAQPAAEKQSDLVRTTKVRAAYEHPFAIRLTHWVNAVSVFVLVTSGLRIFRAFPSFGPKIPEQDLIDIPKALTLGGWLGGALQWHFTFMWLFAGSGVIYLAYQLLSGHYRTVLFTPKDIPGVRPMVRHYFFFGPKPAVTEQYNPLQKLAYTSTVGFGVLSFLTGLVLYKPAQFSWLAFLFGGFHLTRIWHFASMCGFVAFIPGHLIMVALHGWSNFYSMLSGWKREPEYQD